MKPTCFNQKEQLKAKTPLYFYQFKNKFFYNNRQKCLVANNIQN